MKARLLVPLIVGLLLGQIGLPALCAPSQSTAAPVMNQADPNTYVEIPENTGLQVLTDRPLNSKHAREGTSLSFTLNKDIIVHNTLIIPHGVTLHGMLVRSKRSGKLTGSPELIIELTSLDLEGRNYPLYTYQFEVKGTSKTPQTEVLAANGAYYGALAGAIGAGKTGASTETQKVADVGAGAAAGAGVAAAAVIASGRSSIDIPAEAELTFHLAAPIAVVPVSPEEAARINKEHPHGDPVLYLRGETF